MAHYLVGDVLGLGVEVPGIHGEVGGGGGELDPLGRLHAMHHPVPQVDVSDGVVVIGGVVVGHKQMDVESHEVDLQEDCVGPPQSPGRPPGLSPQTSLHAAACGGNRSAQTREM